VAESDQRLNTHSQRLSRGFVDAGTGKAGSASTIEKIGQGAAQHRKLPIACRRCNGEWMGRIEQRARVLMAQLIKDEPVILEPVGLAAIAAWGALKAIVNEYTEPETRCIPDDRRKVVMNTETAPDDFFVSIGRLASPALLAANLQHQTPKELLGSAVPFARSLQSTAFFMRNLMVYVVTFDPSVYVYEPSHVHPELATIWPSNDRRALPWTALSPLSRRRSQEIAMSASHIAEKRPVWGRMTARIAWLPR
jgi:hypothetical protein